MVALTPVPDILVTGDGQQVGITMRGPDGSTRLVSLRDSRSSYTRDNLMELAGVGAEPVPLAAWPDARCSEAFCTLTVARGGRSWVLLLGRDRSRVEERALAAACAEADIVVAERFLPRSCRPRWLKADRRFLERSGGIAIDLAAGRITTVAAGQGEHGWWQVPEERAGPRGPAPSDPAPAAQIGEAPAATAAQ